MARNPGKRFEKWIVGEFQRHYKPEDVRETKGSGNVHGDGDVEAGPWTIEAKDNPDQKSISIPEDDWKKIEAAAGKTGRMPLFFNKNKHGVFVTMKWLHFEQLLSEAIKAFIFLDEEPDAF